MILIDGRAFATEGISEVKALRKFSSHDDSLTGQLVVTESQAVRNRRTYTLLLTKEDVLTFEDLVAEVGVHELIDHTGFAWRTTAGTDNALNAYSTGAYFPPNYEAVFRPQQSNGDACDNRWQCDVTMVINAKGVRSDSATPIGSGGIELDYQIPGGTINGTNDTFTLTVNADVIQLYKNGMLLTPDGVDYSYTDGVITYVTAVIPQVGDTHIVYYGV